jgi:prophage antirepressor-like protein
MKRYLTFNRVAIAYVIGDDGTPYLPVKSLCEVLGLKYEEQRIVVKNHPIFAKVSLLRGVPSAGGTQETSFERFTK